MSLNEEELRRIVSFMKDHYGVELAKKSNLIEGRLSNKLEAKGYVSYSNLMDKVEANPGGEDAAFLVNMLTTNHTYFMREKIHFDFLRDVALPELRKSAMATHDIRIWSAAASSGEEAYTIVMTIKDFFGMEAEAWDTTVLATDVSTKVLTEAKEGIYREDELTDLPERWMKLHFSKLPDGRFQVKPETRHEVIFNTFNLMDDFHWKKKFNVIFLRNVMIYFDEQTKEKLIGKMIRFLEQGGYLIIGTTETLEDVPAGLEHVSPSIYRRVAAATG